MVAKASLVADRQAPLRRAYLEDPKLALSMKSAATRAGVDTDAFHSIVEVGKGYGVSQRLGIDHMVGGYHDLPNPADLLCAALAACEDSAVRMIADLLGVRILDLRVEVTGEVDVRGALAIDRSVRVGFRSMNCSVQLCVPQNTEPQRLAALRKHSEASCVNLDTLRSGVPVAIDFAVQIAEENLFGTSRVS